MTLHLLLGQTLRFSGDPFAGDWADVTHHDSEGGVLIRAGKVVAVGAAKDLHAAHPNASVTD